MSAQRSTAAARRVFLTLTFTRWFPVGLIVGIMTLWPLERGLTVAETLSATALVGITVFALELPTSGFADAFGRRPVYVASAVVSVVGSTMRMLLQRRKIEVEVLKLIARGLTNTFAGIAPAQVIAFILAQIAGAVLGAVWWNWLFEAEATHLTP